MNNDTMGESSAMGHDPLAWIAKEGEQTEVASSEVNEQTPVEPEASSVSEAVVKDELKEKPVESIDHTIALAEKAATGVLIVLEGDVGIANVNELHEELCEALQQTSKVTIQAASLSHVDTAAAQLLYAFVRDAKKLDVEVQWQGVPESCLKIFQVIGLPKDMAA